MCYQSKSAGDANFRKTTIIAATAAALADDASDDLVKHSNDEDAE
jgi:hypothetical protein